MVDEILWFNRYPNKRLAILLALAVLLVSGCGVLRQTPEERQRTTELIGQRLDARDYRIDIDVHCQNRDDISYRGTVSTREEPEE